MKKAAPCFFVVPKYFIQAFVNHVTFKWRIIFNKVVIDFYFYSSSRPLGMCTVQRHSRSAFWKSESRLKHRFSDIIYLPICNNLFKIGCLVIHYQEVPIAWDYSFPSRPASGSRVNGTLLKSYCLCLAHAREAQTNVFVQECLEQTVTKYREH